MVFICFCILGSYDARHFKLDVAFSLVQDAQLYVNHKKIHSPSVRSMSDFITFEDYRLRKYVGLSVCLCVCLLVCYFRRLSSSKVCWSVCLLICLFVCLWLLLWSLLLVFPSFAVVHNFFCLGFCHFVCVYDGVF